MHERVTECGQHRQSILVRRPGIAKTEGESGGHSGMDHAGERRSTRFALRHGRTATQTSRQDFGSRHRQGLEAVIRHDHQAGLVDEVDPPATASPRDGADAPLAETGEAEQALDRFRILVAYRHRISIGETQSFADAVSPRIHVERVGERVDHLS